MMDATSWLASNSESVHEPVSLKPIRILEAVDLEDDYYLNLLDWSKHKNTIAIGLKNCVYGWDADSEVTSLIANIPEEDSVASVSWMPDSSNLAIGTKLGRIELIDTVTGKSVKRFSGHCKHRTGM